MLIQRRRSLLPKAPPKKHTAISRTRTGRKSGRQSRGSLPSILPRIKLPRQRVTGSLALPDESEDGTPTLVRSLVRLWCHENTRVFADKLSDSKDRIWFVKLLEVCLKYCFCGVSIQTSGPSGDTGMDRASGGTSAVTGGRRLRPGRQRPGGIGLGSSASRRHGGGTGEGGVEPLSADLAASGIKMDMLENLLPSSQQHKLINYDQVTVRGEDLSDLLFVKLATSQQLGKEEESSGEESRVDSAKGTQK